MLNTNNPQASPESVIETGTPVNETVATKVLTVGAKPLDNETVTIDAEIYTYVTALTETYATGIIDFNGNDFGTVSAPEGTTITIGGTEIYEFDSDGITTPGNIAIDLSGSMIASQGTLTVDTQPTIGNTMIIGVGGGVKVYTFVAEVDADADGEIGIGADLAGAKINIVAAINGTDAFNTAHTQVTAGAFIADNSIITAKVMGIFGDTIATTETFTAITNVFDAGTLGTTTAGSGATATACSVAFNSAINTNSSIVSSTNTVGEIVDVTSLVIGLAGNAITGSSTTADWDILLAGPGVLSGGLDPILNEILVEATAELSIDNLVSCINHVGADEGVKWGTGTVINPYVTASKASASTMLATAKVAGSTYGNAIALGETLSNGSWAGGAIALTGGVDATSGPDKKVLADANYIYISTAESTIYDGNWAKIGNNSGIQSVNEVPAGAVNGANKSFTLAHTPMTGTLALFLDGVRYDATGYTVVGTALTTVDAPVTTITVDYSY